VLTIIVLVVDLARSFGKVKSGRSLDEVLKVRKFIFNIA